jgi:hypothetical protein
MHSGRVVHNYEHIDYFMSILHAAMKIIGSELYIHVGYSDHANGSMSILYPFLAIIGGELCILVCW